MFGFSGSADHERSQRDTRPERINRDREDIQNNTRANLSQQGYCSEEIIRVGVGGRTEAEGSTVHERRLDLSSGCALAHSKSAVEVHSGSSRATGQE